MRSILTLLLLTLFLITTAKSANDLPVVVQARDVQDSIDKGNPIKYDNHIIEGDLNLSGLDISRDVHFNNSIFQGSVDFTSDKFKKDAYFIGAQFKKKARFDKTQFDKIAVFWFSKFIGEAAFSKCRFIDAVSFHNSTFAQDVRFFGARFDNGAWFWESIFEGNSRFDNTIFKDQANFMGTQFKEYSSFDGSQFNDNATFNGALFEKSASFYDALFEGPVSFNGANFDEGANFRNVEFKGTLDITKLKFVQLFINWDSMKGNRLICNGPVYLDLIKNFKNLEQFVDADNCYYQYRDQKRASIADWSLKIIDYLAWFSCGYGVKPEYTLGCMMVFISIFGLTFWTKRGLRKQNADPIIGPNISIKDAFYFSAMTFFSGNTDLLPVREYKYIAALEKITGWLFMALFLVTLNHVMIRPSL